MAIRLMRGLEMVTGFLLGGLCVGAQIGSVLVCLGLISILPMVIAGESSVQ